MTEKYLIERGGICGQACLAVIEGQPISQVLKDWKDLGFEFKGWSGWKQLREYLEKKNYTVKQVRANKEKVFVIFEDAYLIARVQWIGEKENKEKPFYGWGHWTEASAHTHFILIHDEKFFCNETGVLDFELLGEYLNDDNGIITSYLAIKKNVRKCQNEVRKR